MSLFGKTLDFIETSLRDFRFWKSHVWDKENTFKVSHRKKIKYAIKGFTANESIWYDLENNDIDEYISDYIRMKSRNINGAYTYILDDKIIFEEIFRQYVRVPENYAWIKDGIIYGLHQYVVNNESIMEFINEKKIVVLKWVRTGGGGVGTYVIKTDENGDYWIGDKKSSREEILKMFRVEGEAFLCEYMEQSDFEDSLYPYATNTIRIVCAKKKGDKDVHIIKAAQRIGNDMSKPVDNVSMGAIVCEIDVETGELGSGVIAKSHCLNNKHALFFEKHPDTGAQLKGLVIPNWIELKQQMINLTNKFPYLNFVGWDVLLLKDGFCVIEGNASAGVTMFQMNHGIKDEEIGQIYKSYGIIE